MCFEKGWLKTESAPVKRRSLFRARSKVKWWSMAQDNNTSEKTATSPLRSTGWIRYAPPPPRRTRRQLRRYYTIMLLIFALGVIIALVRGIR
jgi:hypothetical protein